MCESQQYSKLKQNNVDLKKNLNIPKLQNNVLPSVIDLFKITNKKKRDTRGHDPRILDDESKQIFIQFELSRAKHIWNTLNNYQPGTDLYSMITDKTTVVVITHLSEWHDRVTICFHCRQFVETSDKATSLQSFTAKTPWSLVKSSLQPLPPKSRSEYELHVKK